MSVVAFTIRLASPGARHFVRHPCDTEGEIGAIYGNERQSRNRP